MLSAILHTSESGISGLSIPISKLTKFEVRRIFTEHPDTGYMLSYLLQAGYLTIKR